MKSQSSDVVKTSKEELLELIGIEVQHKNQVEKTLVVYRCEKLLPESVKSLTTLVAIVVQHQQQEPPETEHDSV